MTQPQEPFATCRVCGKEPGQHCRVHYVAEVTELRAALEGALLFVDQVARRQIHEWEGCESYNACHNAECDCPEEDDGGAIMVTHETGTCTCLTYDAMAKAKDIRAVLARTLGNRVTTQDKETNR